MSTGGCGSCRDSHPARSALPTWVKGTSSSASAVFRAKARGASASGLLSCSRPERTAGIGWDMVILSWLICRYGIVLCNVALGATEACAVVQRPAAYDDERLCTAH